MNKIILLINIQLTLMDKQISAVQVDISRRLVDFTKVKPIMTRFKNKMMGSRRIVPFISVPDTSTTTITKITQRIAIIDFLNLARKDISGRGDAKFVSIDEMIGRIEMIAHDIKNLGDFHKIYIVTKSFKFNERISYTDVIKIILWAFCKTIPEWKQKFCLVLVNGINDKDKEADDRALFILYNEFSKTTKKDIVILSNDKFDSLKSHYFRKVTLNFYVAKSIDYYWNTSNIVSTHKGIYQQDKQMEHCYRILHPFNQELSEVEIKI